MDKIRTINITDKEYPQCLREISNPPNPIYIRGNIYPDEIRFAVVGTRRYSIYGKEVALDIAGQLSEAGLTIVSGLAPGIDTFSHMACVERKRRTIAVLGTGIDEKSIYPRNNIGLAEKILEAGGALISEYPPGTRGTRFTFPQRNRIISGLSIGILVVEAKIKSGALITASWAKSQRRKIFVIPGSIYSSNSKGCHKLIKAGAELVESADDILEKLKLNNIRRNSKLSNVGDNKEENEVLKALSGEALYIDEIIKRTNLSPNLVASTLAILEIKGKVKDLGGNIYTISR